MSRAFQTTAYDYHSDTEHALPAIPEKNARLRRQISTHRADLCPPVAPKHMVNGVELCWLSFTRGSGAGLTDVGFFAVAQETVWSRPSTDWPLFSGDPAAALTI